MLVTISSSESLTPRRRFGSRPVLAVWIAGATCGLGVAFAGETEFGGGVAGPDSRVATVLRELADRGGFRWIRSASPRVAQSGFEGISDVRLYVPRNRGLPESDRLPEDLFETYRMCRDALPGFEGSPRVWEIWNEPDFYFVRDSAADMAATLKAAWWGVKAARPDAEVLMPSLAFRPGRYAVELARNGVASWTDGWNVHFYGWAVDYSDFLVQHRAFAEAIGCRKPLWVTEIGYLGMPVSAAENPGAEAAQAAFHQRTMVDSRAYEVDRHLLFLLTPHAEARNELGLTTAEGRWRPALDQAARLAGHLREARPLFRLARRSDGESMGWVFETEDRAWWTVLWKPGRPGESAHPGGPVPSFSDATRPKFRWPADWVEIRVGLDGDVALVPSQIPEIELSADTVVHFRTPPERFGIEGCEWVPWPRTSSRSPRFPSPLRSELRGIPPVREPSPVVVRFRAGSDWISDKPAQVLVAPQGNDGVADLQFFNFDMRDRSGRWEVEVSGTWTVVGEGGKASKVASGRPELIPAQTRRSVPLRLSCRSEARRITPAPARLTARWIGDDGSVDECSVRLRMGSEPNSGVVRHAWTWRELRPGPGQPDGWQLFRESEDVTLLEVRRPSEQNREVSVHLPLPRGLRATDRFCVGLRRVRGLGTPYVQVQMTTSRGESWRHGELVPLGAAEQRVDAALGDFSPAIWSRHVTPVFPPVDEARGVTLAIQGVAPGDVLEIRSPEVRR